MTLYVGARDPERVDLTITSADLDLSLVTSLELTTHPPSSTATWAWSIVSQSAATMLVRHTFAAAGTDVPRPGQYIISGWVVTATTRRRITPVSLTAVRY